MKDGLTMKQLMIVLTGLIAVAAAKNAHGAIEIHTGGVTAAVHDHSNNITTSDELNWPDYVGPTSLTASNSVASNVTNISYTTNGAETLFSFSFDHKQTGGQVYAQSYGLFYFTPDTDLSYDASGFYNATSAGGLNNVQLYFELRDASMGGYPFYSHQTVNNEAVVQFVIGGTEGEWHPWQRLGEPAGTLLQGRTYLINFSATTENGDDLGFASTGNITLSLSNPAAVPEPAQLAVWLGLGLCGAVFYGLRRRAPHALT